MAKPFKFRYVNELAGLFVLATVAVLCAGAFVASKTHDWFRPVMHLRVELPVQGSMGLRAGSVVSMLGTEVGDVAEVNPPDENGRMEAVITVRKDFGRFITADSRAVIGREFGVAGDATLDISRGQGEPLAEYTAIPAMTDTSYTDQLQEILKQVKVEFIPMIAQVRVAVAAYTDVAHDLHDPDGRLQQTLARFDAIAAQIQAGQGLAGKVVSDPELARHVSALLVSADKASDALASITGDARVQVRQLPALIADVQKTLHSLQDLLADARKTTTALPGVVVQTQETERQVQRLVEQLQHSWLLGGGAPAEAATSPRIDPSEAEGAGMDAIGSTGATAETGSGANFRAGSGAKR